MSTPYIRPLLRPLVIGAWLSTAGTVAVAADGGTFTVTTGFDYSTGKYGSAAATSILYVPIITKYESGRWTSRLVLPYLEITSPGTVVGAGRDQVVIGTSQSTVRTTATGMGDVIGAVTYALLEGAPHGLFLDLTGKVKFPTGDKEKGLSTGERDYSVLLDIYRSFGRFTLLGALGYKVNGDPDGLNLNNVWQAGVGGAWKFSPSTSGGVLWDVRQASRVGSEVPRDLTTYLTHKLNDTLKLQLYMYHGFSNASADWGGGAMIGVSY